MIRETFALLLLSSVLFCAADPPINEVDAHNLEIAPSLMGTNALTVGKLYRNNSANVNMSIVSAFPQVDYSIPQGVEGILWAWNEKNADGVTLTEEPDSNGCTDKYYPTLVNYTRSATMRFLFRNETRSVTLIDYSFLDEVGGKEFDPDPVVGIPFSQSELGDANGTENLTVVIEWYYYYQFEARWDRESWNCENESCHCESDTLELEWEDTDRANVSRQFVIEPGKANFMLVRPVLGEQWYANDHFDSIVFARKRVYTSSVYVNGTRVAKSSIYNFSVFEDPLGAWHIFSNKTQVFDNSTMGGWDIGYRADPLVRENNSFAHLYEINYTYSSWGPSTVVVSVRDFFLGEENYSKTVLNRKNTNWGRSETGEGADGASGSEYYRPSEEKPEVGGLSDKILPVFGLWMLMLLAALGAIKYYKGSGRSR